MASLTSMVRQKADELKVNISEIPPYAVDGVKDYDFVYRELLEVGKRYAGTRPSMWFPENSADRLTDQNGMGSRLSAAAALIYNGNKPLSANQLRKAVGTMWIYAPIEHLIKKDGTVKITVNKVKYPFLERVEAVRESSDWISVLQQNFLGERSVDGLSKLFTEFPPEENRKYYLKVLDNKVNLTHRKDGKIRKGHENQAAALGRAIEEITRKWE
jgi:hypothetical protein